MKDAVILSAVRTPIGKFQGSLKSLTAPQLGSIVVRAAIERAGLDPSQANLIDEVIMGCVLQAGLGQTRRVKRRSARVSIRRSPRSRSIKFAARG